MTTFFIIFFSLFFNGNPSHQVEQDQMTTYYFIRHAEKDLSDPSNKDPQLTERGLQRAKDWSVIFKEVSFDLILSTDFNRTRKTAEIIAQSQKQSVEIYNHLDLNNEQFQSQTWGKTSLIVGHSNTNPKFVNLILGENKYKDIDENESGSLFIVQVSPDGTASCQVLYIN